MGLKICSVCKKELPATVKYFRKYTRGRTIFKPRCRKCDKECDRKKSCLCKYGITLEEYNELLNFQDGVCAICGQPETRKRKGENTRLSVDHNHETGVIRGLLCNNCNTAIGLLKNNPRSMRRAAEYVESEFI